MMAHHEMKAWPQPFLAVASGAKRFEYRADDRTPRFAVGDSLKLREFEPCERCAGAGRFAGHARQECCPAPHGDYTGHFVTASVTYVLRNAFGVPDGWAVLSIASGMMQFEPVVVDGSVVAPEGAP